MNDNKYKFYSINVQIIQSGAWPIDAERVSKVNSIQSSLLLLQSDFDKFYAKTHEGTQLAWDYMTNSVELEGRFCKMGRTALSLENCGEFKSEWLTGTDSSSIKQSA